MGRAGVAEMAKSARSARSTGRSKPSRPASRPRPRPAPRRPTASKASKPSKSAPKRPAPAAKKAPAPPRTAGVKVPVLPNAPPSLGPIGRNHVLSLSFLRDGDEFMARLETDTGQITELKNRSLDQLLTLVASELEDLLE